MTVTTTRTAAPGELCTCGRQATEVFEGGPFGDTGYCGRADGGDKSGPCRFCGERRDSHDGRCPKYVLRPEPTPDPPAEQLAAELAVIYTRTGETLDELLAVAFGHGIEVDPATEFAAMANNLSGSSSENLAQLLAVAIQRLAGGA